MDGGLTFAVDDYPAVVLGGMLRDLLAGELHGLLVVAIVIHGGEAYMLKLCSKKSTRLPTLYRCAVCSPSVPLM